MDSNSFVGNFRSWLAAPYRDDMSAWDWFKFLGLLIVLSAIWALVFKHIREAIK